MDSSRRPNRVLHEVLDDIIQWIWRADYAVLDEAGISRISGSHLSTIRSYVSDFDFDSDFNERIYTKFCLNELWQRRYELQNRQKVIELILSFRQDLQELSKALDTCCFDNRRDQSRLFTEFISFLVELLLDHRRHWVDFNEDQISTLVKELRFLTGILWDIPWTGTDKVEEIKNFLVEAEGVVNEAGSLVLSLIFTTTDGEFKIIDEAVGVLLQHIDLLKANIITVSKFLSYKNPVGLGVDSLLRDLEDLMNCEDDRIVDLKDEIKILHQVTVFSQSLLNELKVTQRSKIEELKEHRLELKGHMQRIRQMTYGVKHLINYFLLGEAPLWYLTVGLTDAIREIKLIGIELQEIKKNYDFGALQVAKDLSAQLSLHPKRTSDVDDVIVGFEVEATDILDKLVGGTEHLQVISIFGMPGLGKTTLAKKLYNHPFVAYHFDKCSWCVVSQTYHRESLLIEILNGLASDIDKASILNMEEESLIERIYKSLRGSRFLIIIDDIWDSNVWDDLRRYFPDVGNGSRILFTSRNKDVAPPNSIVYALPNWTNDQCWELLEKKVFQNTPCPPQLLKIGKEIAAHCHGLPLAVVVIAGILSTMGKEECTWKYVGGRLASHISPEQSNSMMQLLKLSYKHLPEHLKPCFLYFGAFAEDTEVHVRKLKCLWIAEGFIHKEEKKKPESVAEEYLMELIDRCLVIVTKRRSDGGAKSCLVHDLLRDLCLRIAKEENFMKFDYSARSRYHQRLCLQQIDLQKICAASFSPTFGFQLRSMFASIVPYSPIYVGHMKLLRILDLPKCCLQHNCGIEVLVYLRCLTVYDMKVSIVSLVNLEFLVVSNGTVRLSSEMQRMVKLRYLSCGLAFFGQGWDTSQTSNLEFLSWVKIKDTRDEEILFKCFPHLRKLKCICQPLRDPDFSSLTQLESLNLFIPFISGFISNKCKVAAINLPSNLKKLTLMGMWLPWEKMSKIGELPNLQVLKLRHVAFVGEKWDTREDEFQELKLLELEGLNIAQWNVESSKHFPKLQRLVLRDCHELQEIPCEMGYTATLELIEVESCKASVAESATEIQQVQCDTGNEDLRVIIRRREHNGVCGSHGVTLKP